MRLLHARRRAEISHTLECRKPHTTSLLIPPPSPQDAVTAAFDPVLHECASSTRMRDMLDMAEDLLSQLVDIHDYAVPCFPPHYGLFPIVARLYNKARGGAGRGGAGRGGARWGGERLGGAMALEDS